MGKNNKMRDRRLLALGMMIFMIIIAIAILVFTDLTQIKETYIVNISFDIAGMLSGIVILICCIIGEKENRKDINYFTILVILCFSLMFADEISWIVDGVPDLYWINVIDNTGYYAIAQILVCIFWYYVIEFVGKTERSIIRLSYIISIGSGIFVILCVLNIKFRLFFDVDEATGIYSRSKYNMISFIYVYFVLAAAFVTVIKNRKRINTYNVAAFMAYILVPVFVSVFSIFVYGISILYPSVMWVLLVMYCMINVERGRQNALKNHDLELAKKIQADALPKKYPAFPDRAEFDLYATMIPARDVAGDFYDFFMVDDDHLAVIIADVSGKGMPAALFMMSTKTLVKSAVLSARNSSPSIIFDDINTQLCESNEEGFFVTAWLGILCISTGQMVYCNAGHEHPALYRAGGGFILKKEKHSPPLGADNDAEYTDSVLKLNKNDMIYIYTDGILEAHNRDKEMFGETKLIEVLNKETNVSVKQIVQNVNIAIDGFANGVEQFDDVTMLCMKYNGSNSIDDYVDDKVTSLKLEATIENFASVIEFIKDRMSKTECEKSICSQIYVAVEEIYVNIASYAYPGKVGKCIIETEIEEDPRAFTVRFIDNGVKYNPLKKDDPDVTLSAQNRKIGGLGIFIVKKSMDFLYYEHKGGNNIFIMKKYF